MIFLILFLAIAVFASGFVIGAEHPSVLAEAKAELLSAQAEAQRIENDFKSKL